MKIDNPFNLLMEAAESDINIDTQGSLTESAILNRYRNIDECSKHLIIAPEAVPVFSVDECYLVEMNAIAGYMKSTGITSVSEALDIICSANKLDPYSVGLLVESDDEINGMLEKANAKGSKKAKNSVLEKIKKSTDISDKLKKKGYPVKKKKCGSPKDECGDTNECGSTAEGCKK
jgi:hypothetical protein